MKATQIVVHAEDGTPQLSVVLVPDLVDGKSVVLYGDEDADSYRDDLAKVQAILDRLKA